MLSGPPGAYANGTGNHNCTDCSAGWYAEGPGNGWCEMCGPGTISHDEGQATCQDCKLDKHKIAYHASENGQTENVSKY